MKVTLEFNDLKLIADEADRCRNELEKLRMQMDKDKEAIEFRERRQDAYQAFLDAKSVWLDKVISKLGKTVNKFIDDDFHKMNTAWHAFDAVQKENVK